MIDLHCHMLPGIDDGAPDLAMALAMARASVADGVTIVACTPHILPGLYHNSGPQIRLATEQLQRTLYEEGIELRLVTGADNHMVPNFGTGVQSGHLLALADSRYVLVEPPHHAPPPRLEEFFFGLMVAGFVPILTHPERLKWIESHFDCVQRLAHAGVWMQVTASSLTGSFGRSPKYWSERMLDEGLVHILASDAHDTQRRPPNLGRGYELAAGRVGEEEAGHLVVTRPAGVLENVAPSVLPMPGAVASVAGVRHGGNSASGGGQRQAGSPAGGKRSSGAIVGWLSRRLRGAFE